MEHQIAANKSQTDNKVESACCPKSPAKPGGSVYLFRELNHRIGNRALGRHIQAKLKVSEPGDVHELEADRIAEQVMRMPDPTTNNEAEVPSRRMVPQIQRLCTECEEAGAGRNSAVPQIQRKCGPGAEDEIQRKASEEEDEAEVIQTKTTGGAANKSNPTLEGGISTFGGSGQALPPPVRAFFEPRFGYDFGAVRVHADTGAARAASDLGARAFAAGRDVFFGAGEYAPHAVEGRRLIAHELAHVVQQRESGDDEIRRTPDDSGTTNVMIFRGVPTFLSCETSELDTDPDTSCCSSDTRSRIPALYTTSRAYADRAIQRMADGATMDGAITRHFGSGALGERSEILRRLRIIRAALDAESTHVIRCRIALNGRNTIGFDLIGRVDRRLFCQVGVLATGRLGGNVATLCVDIDGNPVSGWETLFHEMVHLSGVGNLPDRDDATPAQTSAREYETYQHESREAIDRESAMLGGAGLAREGPARPVLYPNPMPFSLRNADSFSSFVAQVGAESWSAESNVAAYLPTLEAGPLMTFEGAPRFGVGGGMLWTPFGSNIQPIIGARALWLPRRDQDVAPAVQPTDLRAYAGVELGMRWIVGGSRVQFVLDVAGGAGPYVTVDNNVDPALAARLGLGLRVGGPQLGFGIGADFMRLFHFDQGALVGNAADDWLGGLVFRGHWGGSSSRPR
ncbi:MAG: DUF4157 domain-containing protein [Pyrinomonadaceae bacterium]